MVEAALGVGRDVALQLLDNGGNLDCIDWGQAAASGLGGMAGPALGGLSKAVTALGVTARGTMRVISALQTPERIVVDSRGNAIPLNPGEYLTRSPDGRWVQVRDARGNPTGTRIDGPHNPRTHSDPRAQEPHAHVPGVTNPDGTPWLPIE